MKITIASFFSGAGGLDLGFIHAGFEVVWSNEFDKDIWETYAAAHPGSILDTRNMTQIPMNEIPNTDGIIGSPPCQPWSVAGKNLGERDMRGQLFTQYIEILHHKNPKFFVIENVEGLTRSTHATAFTVMLDSLRACGSGYTVHYAVLNAADYEVPQDRKRLFIVGFRNDIVLTKPFEFPKRSDRTVTLRDAIYDLKDLAVPTTTSITSDPNCYIDSGYSSNYMSRNRVRGWDEVGFTVPASSRHVTMHPQAPKMLSAGKDRFMMVPGSEELYRRFTVNELARIQTFPDGHFKFRNINAAYKMIGNAVPCKLAEYVARAVNAVLPSPVKPERQRQRINIVKREVKQEDKKSG